MNSFTQTSSQTFTVTHARYLASKVATDLKRMQRLYGQPSDQQINDFETELIELLRNGYLDHVSYGFNRDGKWIEPTLRYTAKELASFLATDDDPGRVRPGANIEGASFYSFLCPSSTYLNLTQDQRNSFETALPFKRSSAEQPGISGYLSNDKTYTSGGRSLDRSYVKNY